MKLRRHKSAIPGALILHDSLNEDTILHHTLPLNIPDVYVYNLFRYFQYHY